MFYSSSIFEGDPNSLIVVPGKCVYPGKIAMSKQKYHDHPMWWYCIGEAIFVHWLLNQTDISQWDLLINISQIDRNFRAKLPSVFWLRPSGIWLYRYSLHICAPEITQGPAIKRGNGKSPRNGGCSSHDCQRVAKSTRTITVAGTKTTFVNRIWTDLSLVNLEISSIQWPREAL